MTAALDVLRDHIRRLEQPVRHAVLPFGAAAIDAALPGGGLALGALHEFLGAGSDEEDAIIPAAFIAAILARLGPHPPRRPLSRIAGEGGSGCSPEPGEGPVLWCLKTPDLYGPGLAAHGLDPTRLILVAVRRDEELLWAMEEGLRVPGLAAVVGEIGRLSMVAGRRLQLAAERSGVTALVLRRWRNAAEAAAERARPTAALTRWRIGALSSSHPPHPIKIGGRGLLRTGRENEGKPWVGRPYWRVELLRCRGGVPAAWMVEAADATGHVSLSAQLADRPAAPQRHAAEPRRRLAG